MALSLPVKVMVLLWKLHGNKEATIMKRITNIRTLAVLLMASAAIVSCSVKEDIFEEETTIKEEPAKVYTLSVNAPKAVMMKPPKSFRWMARRSTPHGPRMKK